MFEKQKGTNFIFRECSGEQVHLNIKSILKKSISLNWSIQKKLNTSALLTFGHA